MSRGWARGWVLLATLIALGLTARLGWWQLDRAAQKTELLAHIAQRAAMPPLPATELAKQSAQVPDQVHRRIALAGRWLPEFTVYLDNRQMNGRPGFFVVTPLELAPGDAVLVQRGWMPRDFIDRSRLRALPTPTGVVSVTGRVAAWPSRLFEFSGSTSGPIRQNLELVELSRESGRTMRPLSVQQSDEPDTSGTTPATDELLRNWPVANLDISKHHGYAFQWFALCALIAGLYVWFQWIRPRPRHDRPH